MYRKTRNSIASEQLIDWITMKSTRQIFALTFGLVLTFVNDKACASPSIWWSGEQNIIMGPGPPPPPPSHAVWNMDLLGNALIDYVFTLDISAQFIVSPEGSNRAIGPMSLGAWIGTGSSWASGDQVLAYWQEEYPGQLVCAGPWSGVTNGYLGLEFDVAGSLYYGWARITVNSGGGYATIRDWACETAPGVGISAGAVPEPSTVALMLLAGLGLGVRHRRRRRELGKIPRQGTVQEGVAWLNE